MEYCAWKILRREAFRWTSAVVLLHGFHQPVVSNREYWISLGCTDFIIACGKTEIQYRIYPRQTTLYFLIKCRLLILIFNHGRLYHESFHIFQSSLLDKSTTPMKWRLFFLGTSTVSCYPLDFNLSSRWCMIFNWIRDLNFL
jgi:hypothetical protein